jgi:hypothetical protein
MSSTENRHGIIQEYLEYNVPQTHRQEVKSLAEQANRHELLRCDLVGQRTSIYMASKRHPPSSQSCEGVLVTLVRPAPKLSIEGPKLHRFRAHSPAPEDAVDFSSL